MKKLIALIIILSLALVSFGQKSFINKKEALTWLKETFATHFVKTEVIVKYSKNHSSHYYYDYEFTDSTLQIRSKYISKSNSDDWFEKNHTWIIMPFELIYDQVSEASAGSFENTSGLVFFCNSSPYFQSGYGLSEQKRTTTSSTKQERFPFKGTNNGTMIQSISNAIKAIKLEDQIARQIADAAKKMADNKARDAAEQKLKGSTLQQYKIFTTDSILVSLHDHIEKNRRFIAKPTLLVTFSNEWCGPCLKIIDSILNSGLALKYNIVLVNKDGKRSFSALKMKISQRSPDYNKDAILVFDGNNQLEPLDKNSAPFFLWLDKNLAIISSFSGYNIRISTISKKLLEIE